MMRKQCEHWRNLPIHIREGHLFLVSIRHAGRSLRAGGPLATRSFPTVAKEHASQGPLFPQRKRPASCFWKERLRNLQVHGPNGGLEERAEWNPTLCSDLDQSIQAMWKDQFLTGQESILRCARRIAVLEVALVGEYKDRDLYL